MFIKQSDKPPPSGTILGGRRPSIDKASSPLQAPIEVVKLTPEVFKRKADGLLLEYLSSGDVDEACECIKELRADHEKALESFYMEVLEKKQKNRDMVLTLVRKACETKAVTGAQAALALTGLLNSVEDLEMDIPMMGTYAATFSADLIGDGYVQLEMLKVALGGLAEAGKIAVKLIQQLAAKVGEAKARDLWNEANIDLGSLLNPKGCPEEQLLEFVGEKGIGWLFPLVSCKKFLTQAFREEQDVDSILEWLKTNVSNELLISDQGARTVMKALLTHFGSADDKIKLEKYGKVALVLYGGDAPEMTKKQVQLIYEVQLYCYEKNFADGMLQRLFHAIYDHDMVLEDSFNLWKADTPEDAQGEKAKRAAVLHANKFLQWLAEAEEDSEEEEDDAEDA